MTIFEKLMKEMTPEYLAILLVKPAVVNGTDMYYMTTSGQLFTFNTEGLQKAVDYQCKILTTEVQDSESDNK